MKKIGILLLVAYSSLSLAATINCPTPTDYAFNGKDWKMKLEHFDVSHTCFPLDFSPICQDIQLRVYNPATNVLVLPSHSPVFSSIEFAYTNAYMRVDNSKEITLVCTGNYSGVATSPGLLWGTWTSNKRGNMTAELTLPADYKTCVPVNSNSFECR